MPGRSAVAHWSRVESPREHPSWRMAMPPSQLSAPSIRELRDADSLWPRTVRATRVFCTASLCRLARVGGLSDVREESCSLVELSDFSGLRSQGPKGAATHWHRRTNSRRIPLLETARAIETSISLQRKPLLAWLHVKRLSASPVQRGSRPPKGRPTQLIRTHGCGRPHTTPPRLMATSMSLTRLAAPGQDSMYSNGDWPWSIGCGRCSHAAAWSAGSKLAFARSLRLSNGTATGLSWAPFGPEESPAASTTAAGKPSSSSRSAGASGSIRRK